MKQFFLILFITLCVVGCANQDIKIQKKKTVQTKLNNAYQHWKGTPYLYGGESLKGVDCSALVQNIFKKEFNIDLPRTTWTQVKQGKKISRHNLQKGDLVFFKISSRGRHVGIYKGQGQFINASSSKGVIISRLDNVYWNKHYWTSRRILAH